MMRGVQSTLIILHQYQAVMDGLKPFVCPFPLKYQEKGIFLSGIPVLQVDEHQITYYLFVHDTVVKPKSCRHPKLNLYWHDGEFFLQDCDFLHFDSHAYPLAYTVVKRIIRWQKTQNTYSIFLKQADAKSQVLVHGFVEFSWRLLSSHEFILTLKWPHFPTLSWKKKLC